MPQKMDSMEKKRKQLDFRRKIAMVGADVRKLEKEEQDVSMEMRRLSRKRAQIEAEIKDLELREHRVENELRTTRNELKTQQKRLDRIS